MKRRAETNKKILREKLPRDVIYYIINLLVELHHKEYITGPGGYSAIWENIAEHTVEESLCFSNCHCEYHIDYRKLWVGKKFYMGYSTVYWHFADRSKFRRPALIREKSLLMLLPDITL